MLGIIEPKPETRCNITYQYKNVTPSTLLLFKYRTVPIPLSLLMVLFPSISTIGPAYPTKISKLDVESNLTAIWTFSSHSNWRPPTLPFVRLTENIRLRNSSRTHPNASWWLLWGYISFSISKSRRKNQLNLFNYVHSWLTWKQSRSQEPGLIPNRPCGKRHPCPGSHIKTETELCHIRNKDKNRWYN